VARCLVSLPLRRFTVCAHAFRVHPAVLPLRFAARTCRLDMARLAGSPYIPVLPPLWNLFTTTPLYVGTRSSLAPPDVEHFWTAACGLAGPGRCFAFATWRCWRATSCALRAKKGGRSRMRLLYVLMYITRSPAGLRPVGVHYCAGYCLTTVPAYLTSNVC